MTMKPGKSKATEAAIASMKEEEKRLQMNFPAELHKILKMDCMQNDRQITNVIKELVVNHLKQNGYKNLDKYLPND